MSENRAEKQTRYRPLSAADVRHVVGDLEDHKVAAICKLEPTMEQLEEALAWAQGKSEIIGEEPHPLEGINAAIFDILITDEADYEDRR